MRSGPHETPGREDGPAAERKTRLLGRGEWWTRLSLFLAGLCLVASSTARGQLAPPAGPNDEASARFTLGDIWNRLARGKVGAKRITPFTGPTSGPTAATTKTVDEIMAAAPAVDSLNGASAADVAAGRKFWALRGDGEWGLATGQAPATGLPPAPVERTGQIHCTRFDGTDWVLDATCETSTPAGQDGKLRKGISPPIPRFTKNGDGTVTDNMTGLVWLENANCFGTRVWVDAMSVANSLASGACGLNDRSTSGQWRLPTVQELRSLIDHEYIAPALSNTDGTGRWSEGNPFSGVKSMWYWTSTSAAGVPANAWWVNVSAGHVRNHERMTLLYVWPVRDGP